MSQPMRAAGLALGACALLAACAEAPLAPGSPKIIGGQPLSPYDSTEYCVPLAVGDRLHFEYTASDPVKFELNYRERNAVLAPIVRDWSTGDSGVYLARIAREYCVRWEASPAGAFLDYRLTLQR
jgi:hypothetical protein